MPELACGRLVGQGLPEVLGGVPERRHAVTANRKSAIADAHVGFGNELALDDVPGPIDCRTGRSA